MVILKNRNDRIYSLAGYFSVSKSEPDPDPHPGPTDPDPDPSISTICKAYLYIPVVQKMSICRPKFIFSTYNADEKDITM